MSKSDVFFLAGAALVAMGLYMIYPPLALIVAGSGLVIGGVVMELAARRKEDGDRGNT